MIILCKNKSNDKDIHNKSNCPGWLEGLLRLVRILTKLTFLGHPVFVTISDEEPNLWEYLTFRVKEVLSDFWKLNPLIEMHNFQVKHQKTRSSQQE